jgi:hypothetical protein
MGCASQVVHIWNLNSMGIGRRLVLALMKRQGPPEFSEFSAASTNPAGVVRVCLAEDHHHAMLAPVGLQIEPAAVVWVPQDYAIYYLIFEVLQPRVLGPVVPTSWQ